LKPTQNDSSAKVICGVLKPYAQQANWPKGNWLAIGLQLANWPEYLMHSKLASTHAQIVY